MVELSDLILKIENVVSEKDCDSLINEFDRNYSRSFKEHSLEAHELKIKESTVDMFSLKPGNELFKTVNDYTNKVIEIYDKYLDAFDMFMNKSMLSGFMYSHNYRILCYSKEQSIHDHIDSDFFSVFGSCSLLLNDDYEGGDFRFFKGKYKVKTKKGDALIFPANGYYVHGVDPVTSGKKYAINSFLCTNNYFRKHPIPEPLVQNYAHQYCIDAVKNLDFSKSYEKQQKNKKLSFRV